MKINKYPKVMEVSIYKDFRDSLKRVVFMHKNGMYLAWAGAATLEEADSEVGVTPWPYARDITGNAEHCMGRSEDRKSTRLNSSHVAISYAVFCLKKKNKNNHKAVTRMM